jgi:DNA-directed RNA polymerase specialized sigma24 family protein
LHAGFARNVLLTLAFHVVDEIEIAVILGRVNDHMRFRGAVVNSTLTSSEKIVASRFSKGNARRSERELHSNRSGGAMIQPHDDQAYRRPKCDGPIAASSDAAEHRENSEPRGRDASAYARVINETLGGFRFTEAEAAEFSPQVIGEIERRLPAFLKAATVAGLLPLILRRGRAYFLSKGVPFSDVEELEGKLMFKILDQLSKCNLRGNASAWSKKIQGTIFMDYLRAKYREKRRLGQRQEADTLADVHDAAHDDDARLRELIEEIPADSRDIVERRIGGQEWAVIAAHYQKTVDELKESVRSLEWPEGSGLLRRRRRRRPS